MNEFGTEYKERFAVWKKKEEEKVNILPLSLAYDATSSSQMAFIPKLEGVSPSYEVKQIDKEVELYTLNEALTTEGIADIFCNLLESTLLPLSMRAFEAMGRSRIDSGLLCYVQPNLLPSGESVEQHLSIETKVGEKGAADLFVVIAKTGAKIHITHSYTGGGEASLLARTVVVLCEEDAQVYFSDTLGAVSGAIGVEKIFLVGMSAHLTSCMLGTAPILYRETTSAYLIGAGSSFQNEYAYIASLDAVYDVSHSVTHKQNESHSTQRGVCATVHGGNLICRTLTDTGRLDVQSSNELRIYVAGKDSICVLPKQESSVFRDEKSAYSEEFSRIDCEQVFENIIGDSGLQEDIKKALLALEK